MASAASPAGGHAHAHADPAIVRKAPFRVFRDRVIPFVQLALFIFTFYVAFSSTAFPGATRLARGGLALAVFCLVFVLGLLAQYHSLFESYMLSLQGGRAA